MPAANETVQIAIIVEIEKGRAAAHRFRKEFVAVRAIVVDERDAGRGGDVGFGDKAAVQ